MNNPMQMMGNMAQMMQQLPAFKQQMQQQGVTDPKAYAMQMMQSGKYSQQQLDAVQAFARQNGIQM